jgi:plastocyanin
MQLRFVTAGAALVAAACGTLSHPLSNDGSDSSNPVGANPGTTILTLNVASSSLTVGDTVSITGSLGGAAIQNNGTFQATSSDSSVASVGGVMILARSVGSASINASYNGYQASSPIGISVVPTADSVAAFVSDYGSPPMFLPASVSIKAGMKVSFAVSRGHNVVFDDGTTPAISTGTFPATADVRYPVAGTFTYHCTVHGESGTIVVTP